MNPNNQGTNTRNLTKDQFEQLRNSDLAQFNQLIDKSKKSSSNHNINSQININSNNNMNNSKNSVEYFSNIQNNIEHQFSQDQKNNLNNFTDRTNYHPTSIPKELAKHHEISSQNFNKIINNNYNTFDNFSYPQSTTNIDDSLVSNTSQNLNLNDKNTSNNSNKLNNNISNSVTFNFNKIENQQSTSNNNEEVSKNFLNRQSDYSSSNLNRPIDMSQIESPKTLHQNDISKSILVNNQNNTKSYIANTMPEIRQQQIYLAEIGQKRQLSNLIYQSILKTYQTISNNDISEFQIQELLEREQITDTSDKLKIKSFVANLKLLISRNKEITNNPTTGFISDDRLFEKNTKKITHYLLLDSRDRDCKVWPQINHFGFSFGGKSVLSLDDNYEYQGYINRTFNNVISAELLELIIPINHSNGDYYQNYPYLILDIPQFNNTYSGSNQSIENCFAKISFNKVIGNYAYYYAPHNNYIIKNFNPRINLSRIEIKIKKPNGQLFNFSEEITDDGVKESDKCQDLDPEIKDIIDNSNKYYDFNICIVFKIICIDKSLDTMFLN